MGPARSITFVCVALLLGGCDAKRVIGPPPPVQPATDVVFTAPAVIHASNPSAPGSSFTCQPAIGVSLAGPVGIRLTWTGMGLHIVDTPPYDETFDLAFVQRFWAGEGLSAGETTSSNGMAFGTTRPWLITLRFSYTLTGAATVHTDSVKILCD